MRGHQSILQARSNGANLDQVWVYVLGFNDPGKLSVWLEPENLVGSDLLPEVHIYKSDPVARIDFRFLAGMTVHLMGDDQERTRSVAKRISMFSPGLLLTVAGDQLLTDLQEAA
jgi:hypothetical protein